MDEFIKQFNRERKANKGRWITFHGVVDGHDCWIKSYDTWIQRAEFRGLVDGTPCDCNVGEMNLWLSRFLSHN